MKNTDSVNLPNKIFDGRNYSFEYIPSLQSNIIVTIKGEHTSINFASDIADFMVMWLNSDQLKKFSFAFRLQDILFQYGHITYPLDQLPIPLYGTNISSDVYCLHQMVCTASRELLDVNFCTSTILIKDRIMTFIKKMKYTELTPEQIWSRVVYEIECQTGFRYW